MRCCRAPVPYARPVHGFKANRPVWTGAGLSAAGSRPASGTARSAASRQSEVPLPADYRLSVRTAFVHITR
eukprot:1324719-Prymnesium_polylepis.1